MKIMQLLKATTIFGLLGLAGFGGYATREQWLPLLQPVQPMESHEEEEHEAPPGKVIVSEQAQQNLGLKSKPLKAQTFWRTIQVPGMVVDRPGLSDLGIVAPATGVVSKVFHFPGETVVPGAPLFTLKLLSETLHLTQTELFKATQDITLAMAQRKRLEASAGAIPEARMIEVDNQITRLQVTVAAYRQDLLNRGFRPDFIEEVTRGKFITEIKIVVPNHPDGAIKTPTFELQDLKVELGQQVQAGQTLCLIANHQLLAVEGRAFRDETPLLEKSVREKWPIEVDFQEDKSAGWGEIKQVFRIRHMANTIDPVNRTFAFQAPLENESRMVEDEGRMQMLWRFRPGQKVRIQVRVEKFDNVFVLGADAVARDGPEAYVFTQNVNTFERKAVRVLLQDRQYVVIANDGSILPGAFVAQTAATQLNRMLKTMSDEAPKGFHIHADGSMHKNKDDDHEK